MAVFIVFGLQGNLPWWLVSLVIGRDVVIVLGAMACRWLRGKLEIRPLMISKLNTGLQIFFFATTLFHVALYPLPSWLTIGLQWGVVATTLLSGIAYMILWGRYAFAKG